MIQSRDVVHRDGITVRIKNPTNSYAGLIGFFLPRETFDGLTKDIWKIPKVPRRQRRRVRVDGT